MSHVKKTILTIQYPDGRPINELMKVFYEKMPDLPGKANSFELVRGSTSVFGGGEEPDITLTISFNTLDPDVPATIDDIMTLVKGHDTDIAIGIKKTKSWWPPSFFRSQ